MRVPTQQELARALVYVRCQFIAREHVTGEQLACGLAFGQDRHPDAEDVHDAANMLPQLSSVKWCGITARADYLATEQYLAPRYRTECAL